MAKFVSPLLGYNNNVRHKNRVFHIQTEDSGINHPHIITHLFMDGGRILKSVKTSYAEHLGTEKMNDTVRQMMKDQHKAMFIALRDGQFDHLLDPAKAAAKTDAAKTDAAAKPEAADAAKTDAAKTDAAKTDAAKTDAAKPDAAAKPEAAEPAPAPKSAAPPAPAAALPSAPPPAPAPAEEAAPATVTDPSPPAAAAPADPDATLEMAPVSSPEGPFRTLPSAVPPPSRDKLGIAAPAPPKVPRIVTPGLGTAASALADTPGAPAPAAERRASPVPGSPGKTPSVKDLTMDFDALEASAGAREDGPLYRSNDLPPPPANLVAKGAGSGSYSELEKRPVVVPREEPESPAGVQQAARLSGKPAPQPARLSPTSLRAPQPGSVPARAQTPAPQAEAPKTEQRYAPARPASVFGAAGNRPPPASIFSDELISDKSLDEVILSYLAEDLEPPQRK